jgi:putative transposase
MLLGPALLGARVFFCATAGQVTDEMIQMYLEHHFEPKGDDNFRKKD